MRHFFGIMGFFFLFNALFVSQTHAATNAKENMIWGGFGLAQTESFWAERAPIVPMWALRYEGYLPFVFLENSPWESPLRILGGVHGYQDWKQGTTEFGDSSTQVNGELGFGMGPSYRGSLFVLGTDLLMLAYAGAEFVELNVMEQQRTYINGVAGAGLGLGVYAGFQKLFLRQEMIMGYGVKGYQHQLRWGIAIVF